MTLRDDYQPGADMGRLAIAAAILAGAELEQLELLAAEVGSPQAILAGTATSLSVSAASWAEMAEAAHAFLEAVQRATGGSIAQDSIEEITRRARSVGLLA